MFSKISLIMLTIVFTMFFSACGNQIVLEDRFFPIDYYVAPVDVLINLDTSGSMYKSASGTSYEDDIKNYGCSGSATQARLCVALDKINSFVDAYVGDHPERAEFNIAVANLLTGKIMAKLSSADAAYGARIQFDARKFTEVSSLTWEQGLTSSLYAVHVGANKQEIKPEFRGWYSTDHRLVVIYISDEDDSSVDSCSDAARCYREFQNYKPAIRKDHEDEDKYNYDIKMYGILDTNRNCTPSGNAGSEIVRGAENYHDIIKRSGGKMVDLCSSSTDFDSFYRSIGDNIRNSFPLSHTPKLSSLVVEVDGLALTRGVGYEYVLLDSRTNKGEIKFKQGYVPEHGQKVHIEFKIGSGTEL